jgi:hypothetical protein
MLQLNPSMTDVLAPQIYEQAQPSQEDGFYYQPELPIDFSGPEVLNSDDLKQLEKALGLWEDYPTLVKQATAARQVLAKYPTRDTEGKVITNPMPKLYDRYKTLKDIPEANPVHRHFE